MEIFCEYRSRICLCWSTDRLHRRNFFFNPHKFWKFCSHWHLGKHVNDGAAGRRVGRVKNVFISICWNFALIKRCWDTGNNPGEERQRRQYLISSSPWRWPKEDSMDGAGVAKKKIIVSIKSQHWSSCLDPAWTLELWSDFDTTGGGCLTGKLNVNIEVFLVKIL